MLTTAYETATDKTATDSLGRKYDVYGERRFRMRPTGYSSSRFGACECCEKDAAEMYIQAEQVLLGERWVDLDTCTMGHRECLLKARTTC